MLPGAHFFAVPDLSSPRLTVLCFIVPRDATSGQLTRFITPCVLIINPPAPFLTLFLILVLLGDDTRRFQQWIILHAQALRLFLAIDGENNAVHAGRSRVLPPSAMGPRRSKSQGT